LGTGSAGSLLLSGRSSLVCRGVRVRIRVHPDRAGGGSGTLMDVVDGEDEAVELDDEHLYCWCQMESYGNMISCGDNECEREWVSLPTHWVIAIVCTDLIFVA
jgi:hypothetical protein